jgi:simple sugar transport system permease protein
VINTVKHNIANFHIANFHYERRTDASLLLKITTAVLSVLFSFLIVYVLLLAFHYNPIDVFVVMFNTTAGSLYGIQETIVKATPLILASLGVALAYKIKIFNIGAEGQIYMGAFAASVFPLFCPDLPVHLMLPLMILSSMVMGGIWSLIPGLLKSIWGINEIIISLMLNYVAIYWIDYLVYGPWKDPQGFNFPLSARFPDSAILSKFGNSRVHIGIIFALIAIIILQLMLKKSRWGYELRILGEGTNVAKYAGIKIIPNILIVMFISGGLSGLAGMTEISGICHRLQSDFSPGYGYTAIIIAWLAKLNPISIFIVSLLFSGLLVSSYSIQTCGLSSSTVDMIQGIILLCVLAGDFFIKYKITFLKGGEGK